jgi:hypothetical protein
MGDEDTWLFPQASHFIIHVVYGEIWVVFFMMSNRLDQTSFFSGWAPPCLSPEVCQLLRLLLGWISASVLCVQAQQWASCQLSPWTAQLDVPYDQRLSARVCMAVGDVWTVSVFPSCFWSSECVESSDAKAICTVRVKSSHSAILHALTMTFSVSVPPTPTLIYTELTSLFFPESGSSSQL